MNDVIEVVETRIMPPEKQGMMTVIAPNGVVIQAPYEIWFAALMAQLTDVQQAAMCERVAQMTLEHNGQPSQIIDPRQLIRRSS